MGAIVHEDDEEDGHEETLDEEEIGSNKDDEDGDGPTIIPIHVEEDRHIPLEDTQMLHALRTYRCNILL